MKNLFFILLVAIIATSCATGYYAPHNVNQFGAQTHVVLDKPNFRIVKNIEVVVDISNSNLKRVDVEKSAYAELLRRANITGSQALINVVIEEVRRESMNIFRVLFSGLPNVVQHVAARATVIEFIDEEGKPIQSPETYQGSAPRDENIIQQGSAPRDENTNSNIIQQGNAPKDNQTNNFTKAEIEYQQGIYLQYQYQQPLININSKWKDYTKNIARKINKRKEVQAMYDLNEDGIITQEELDTIDQIYRTVYMRSDYRQAIPEAIMAAHSK
ncbi:MAG: hypothetical protein IKN91_07860 [Paludibacteraceae bacterium]|nr:hypothetical protein [Paludibacteraceae bacterium]